MEQECSKPQMWPSLIAKAKEGGLDVIQTYVFWNVHEPQPGQVSSYQLKVLSLSLSHIGSIFCCVNSMTSVADTIWWDSSRKSRLKGYTLASGLDLTQRVNGLMGTYTLMEHLSGLLFCSQTNQMLQSVQKQIKIGKRKQVLIRESSTSVSLDGLKKIWRKFSPLLLTDNIQQSLSLMNMASN